MGSTTFFDAVGLDQCRDIRLRLARARICTAHTSPDADITVGSESPGAAVTSLPARG